MEVKEESVVLIVGHLKLSLCHNHHFTVVEDYLPHISATHTNAMLSSKLICTVLVVFYN